MGVQRVEDLIAWQLANAFKVEIYRLIRESAGARADHRFRGLLRDAAASAGMNIGEGFLRYGAAEFARYLTIALASLGEATLWLNDGVDREYFDRASCRDALALAKRCRIATLRLQQSLEPFIKRRQRQNEPKARSRVVGPRS
jgi:four helix bundle protein